MITLIFPNVYCKCALLERHFHGVLKIALKVSFYNVALVKQSYQIGHFLSGQRSTKKSDETFLKFSNSVICLGSHEDCPMNASFWRNISAAFQGRSRITSKALTLKFLCRNSHIYKLSSQGGRLSSSKKK